MLKVFARTTSVPMARTLSLIHEMLAEHGAESIMSEYVDRQIEGLAFRIPYKGSFIAFRLPCRWRQVHQLLNRESRYGTEDEIKARRIAWRQVYWWLKAQLALVDTEMVELTEVFLPYAQHTDGKTVYERLQSSDYKLLTHVVEHAVKSAVGT